MKSLRIVGVIVLLFVLAFLLNPLNGILRNSLTGPLSLFAEVGSELVVLIGKFVLLSLIVGLPCVLLGPVQADRGFLMPGLLCGVISSIVSVLKFIAFEKGDFEASLWFVIAPTFAFVYFLLGFATGALWGYLGNKKLWKTADEEG